MAKKVYRSRLHELDESLLGDDSKYGTFRSAVLVSYKRADKMYKDYQKGVPDERVTYLVGQLEMCPTTGRLHLQMYAEFNNSLSENKVKRIFKDENLYCRRKYSTAKACREYCTLDGKDENGDLKQGIVEGSQFEWGEISKQGERTDLRRVAEMVDNGDTLEDIINERPTDFIKYPKGIRDLISAKHKPVIESALTVRWVWGDPGTCKTGDAYHKFGCKIGTFDAKGNFFRYKGEPCIIFNDPPKSLFAEGKGLLGSFLEWIGVFPVELPVKGAYVPRVCSHIYITTNWNPLNIFDWGHPVLRRLTSISKRRVVADIDKDTSLIKSKVTTLTWRGFADEVKEPKYFLFKGRTGEVQPVLYEDGVAVETEIRNNGGVNRFINEDE